MHQNKHFVFVIGTRAQLIKVAPVIIECEKREFECTLLMTGQHLETMQDMLDEFGVKSPQIFALQAREHATLLSLIAWLPRAYIGIVKQLKLLSDSPKKVDVLVHGDTLSTVLGALAGRCYGARLIHLESGLTSNRIFDPFPEEISRRIVFRLAHIAMCPNEETMAHMIRKYPRCKSVNTRGNTILNAIRISGVNRDKRNLNTPYIVVSLHRFQNIYDHNRLLELVQLINDIANILPVHFVLHPATRKRLIKSRMLEHLQQNNGIKLLPRLGYGEFLRLAVESACVLTDGGSNQEELAALGVPTIVMRQTTERSDGLGENAIMEGELKESVLSFINQKMYNQLESKMNIEVKCNPSKTIVGYLVNEE